MKDAKEIVSEHQHPMTLREIMEAEEPRKDALPKSAIEQEIEWCESHMGESAASVEFEKGFIAGLKQALRFEKAIATLGVALPEPTLPVESVPVEVVRVDETILSVKDAEETVVIDAFGKTFEFHVPAGAVERYPFLDNELKHCTLVVDGKNMEASEVRVPDPPVAIATSPKIEEYDLGGDQASEIVL